MKQKVVGPVWLVFVILFVAFVFLKDNLVFDLFEIPTFCGFLSNIS